MKKTAKYFAVSFATPSLNLFLRNWPAMVSELPARLSHLDWLDWNGSKWEPQRSPNTAAISSPAQLSPKLSREATIWASTPFNSMPILGLTILSMPIRLHFNFWSIPGKRHKGVPQSRQRLEDARCWWKLHLYSCFPFLCQITLSIPLKPKTYKTSVMASLL